MIDMFLSRKAKGFLSLIRFELPFSAGVCVVLGQIFALGVLPSFSVLLGGFGAIFFISASILVLNDFFDVEIDKINAPERALPAKLVSPGEVLWLTGILTILGLILSFLLTPFLFFLSLLIWAIGFFYNWKMKKRGLTGNLMVSFSVGITFIFGGISVGVPFNVLVWVFAFLVALIDLGEEIAADAFDIEGDKKVNSNSFAIKSGPQKAICLSQAIFSLAILVSFLPFVFGLLPIFYFFPILLFDGIIVYSLQKIGNVSRKEGKKFIRLIYLSGLVCMLVILLFRLGGV